METPASPLALAAHYIDVARPADALRTLDGAGGDVLRRPDYWLLRARAHFGLREWSAGGEAAANGIALEPEHVELLNLLALCRLNAGDVAEARKTLASALEIHPDNPVLLADLGLVLANMKRFAEAGETINRAVELAPWSQHVLRIRAKVAVLANEDDAGRLVDELLEDDPDDDLAHTLTGVLAARRKRYSAAARAFDEAARLDPQDPGAAGRARNARIVMHPLLAPLRPVWRVGRQKSRVAVVVLVVALFAAGHGNVATGVALSWFGLVVLSWTAPRYLRRRTRRRYGGF
jgi:Flp pilus assembly protein TadD